MNTTIFSLTLQQFFGRRRSLAMFALAAVPILTALVFRLGDHIDPHDWTTNVLLRDIVITTILPLICLIIGSSAFGSEVEDGTAVYILAKPIPRREIILAKFAASVLVAAAFIVPATAISGLIALQGTSEQGIVIGFSLAVLVGVAAYSSIFILLSVVTSRALLFGLAYVFIWEGIATSLFTGTRFLSVRHYALGIADLISSVDKEDFAAKLGGAEAIILSAVVIAATLYLATRRLQTFELSEPD